MPGAGTVEHDDGDEYADHSGERRCLDRVLAATPASDSEHRSHVGRSAAAVVTEALERIGHDCSPSAVARTWRALPSWRLTVPVGRRSTCATSSTGRSA